MNEVKLKFYCDEKRHIVCIPYSVYNLHAMARDLGIKRCWFHAGAKPHYDIPKMRYKEISTRCSVVSERDILKIIKEGLRAMKIQIDLDF